MLLAVAFWFWLRGFGGCVYVVPWIVCASCSVWLVVCLMVC